jgi:metallopeptidase MepB
MTPKHPFREPPQAPPCFTATPSSILQDTQRLIESSRSLQDHIAATISHDIATFQNVLVPLALDENARMAESAILGFYHRVSTDAALREASNSSRKMFDDFFIESRMREDIFKLVDAVLRTQSTKSLDPESENLLNKVHQEFVKSGLKLPAGPQRDRFGGIQVRINALVTEFAKNSSQATTRGVWYAPDELPGIPEDSLSSMEKGSGINEDKVFATFRIHMRPIMRFVTNPESRKRMYIAQGNSCNENAPIFREVTILRDEAARLLGYPSHAALAVEDKMARDTETVKILLNNLRSGLMPAGLRELERYKKLKQEDCEAEGGLWDGHYFVWDQSFYYRKLFTQEYSINDQEIAEYFPLETTIIGMLEIFQHLFGLVFTELLTNGSIENQRFVWHDDVQRFSAWDDEIEGGGFLGYLYLDLYSRDFKGSTPSNFKLIPVYRDFLYIQPHVAT